MKDHGRCGSHVQMIRKTSYREPNLRVKIKVLKCNGFLSKSYVCIKVYVKDFKNTGVESWTLANLNPCIDFVEVLIIIFAIFAPLPRLCEKNNSFASGSHKRTHIFNLRQTWTSENKRYTVWPAISLVAVSPSYFVGTYKMVCVCVWANESCFNTKPTLRSSTEFQTKYAEMGF